MDTFDVPLSADLEPTVNELAAIDREQPLIEAELALLDAEIRILVAEDSASDLDWRRLRRAEHRVMQEARALYGRPSAPAFPREAVA